MNARRNRSAQIEVSRVLAQRTAARKRALAARLAHAERVLSPLLAAIVEAFPVSVLALILSYLPLRERAAYACVHKLLHEASQHASLWSVVHGPLRPDERRTLLSVDTCRRLLRWEPLSRPLYLRGKKEYVQAVYGEAAATSTRAE
jgi:hypothetical protein